MNFIKLSSVADERHYGVKLPVLLKNFNKQELVSMFEKNLSSFLYWHIKFSDVHVGNTSGIINWTITKAEDVDKGITDNWFSLSNCGHGNPLGFMGDPPCRRDGIRVISHQWEQSIIRDRPIEGRDLNIMRIGILGMIKESIIVGRGWFRSYFIGKQNNFWVLV